MLGLFDQPVFKHLLGALIDAFVRARRDPDRVRAAECESHAADRVPCCQSSDIFCREDRQTSIARISLGTSLAWILSAAARVEPQQNAVKIIGAMSRCAISQAFAQVFRALRSGEKAFEQRAQIESGASDDDGQMAARLDRPDLPRLASIFAGRHVARGRDEIEKMVRRPCAFDASGLGRADIELAVQGDRIAVDDLALKAARQARATEPSSRWLSGRERRASSGSGCSEATFSAGSSECRASSEPA